jgi:hypothetical protein
MTLRDIKKEEICVKKENNKIIINYFIDSKLFFHYLFET